jgi:hypothetical protein
VSRARSERATELRDRNGAVVERLSGRRERREGRARGGLEQRGRTSAVGETAREKARSGANWRRDGKKRSASHVAFHVGMRPLLVQPVGFVGKPSLSDLWALTFVDASFWQLSGRRRAARRDLAGRVQLIARRAMFAKKSHVR